MAKQKFTIDSKIEKLIARTYASSLAATVLRSHAKEVIQVIKPDDLKKMPIKQISIEYRKIIERLEKNGRF